MRQRRHLLVPAEGPGPHDVVHVHDGPQPPGLGQEAQPGPQQGGSGLLQVPDFGFRKLSELHPIEVLPGTEGRVNHSVGCSTGPLWGADVSGHPPLWHKALCSAGWGHMGPLGERPHVLSHKVAGSYWVQSPRAVELSPWDPQLPAHLFRDHPQGGAGAPTVKAGQRVPPTTGPKCPPGRAAVPRSPQPV